MNLIFKNSNIEKENLKYFTSMIFPPIEVTITYEDQCKLFMYEVGMPLNEALELLKRIFFIAQDLLIKLIDIRKEAEITSEKSFREDRPLRIVTYASKPVNSSQGNHSSQSDQEDHQANKNSLHQIRFDELLTRSFQDRNILDEINKWALNYKFKLRFGEGKKNLKKKYKLTLVCSTNNCPYKLIFNSEVFNEGYKVVEKLSKKYSQHSKFLFRIN